MKKLIGLVAILAVAASSAMAWDDAERNIDKLGVKTIANPSADNGGSVAIKDSVAMSGNLAVTGNVSVVSNVTVTGTAAITGNSTFSGRIYLSTNCYLRVGAGGTNLLVVSGGTGATTNQIAGW